MNKKMIFITICCLIFTAFAFAQTWDGSTSTDWNTPANWNTNAVPLPAGNVTIPNTVNKPVLAGNVSVSGFNMDAGSALDFNGFTLTSNGVFDINGATLNNSNVATDISITINGTSSKYLRGSAVNDNIIINYDGTSGGFYEGYQFPDTFNGSATFNIGGVADFYTSYNTVSTFNGNVTVNRTAAGATYIFVYGAVNVNGNFSYTNNAGGLTRIHETGTSLVPITGTVNITAAGTGNPAFLMRRIQNQTTGGNISVQNSGLVTIENDTLLLNTFNINGFTGNGTDDFYQNSITGNINISDAATNTGSLYMRGNIINGNTFFTSNSAAGFYEGYQYPDIFNGNTTFNIDGTAIFYTSYTKVSTFNGNVTVNRTVAGPTYIFDDGAVNVNGNFSYSNNAGGLTSIHETGTSLVQITGTVNITADGTGNPAFLMRRIQNQTSGGTISVQNSGLVTIENDTLLLNALNVNGFTSAGVDDFYQNSITGNVNISDAATNVSSLYLRGNIITGNTICTSNSAAGFYEGYQYPDIFNGNVTFNIAGTADFYTSYTTLSSFNGNVTVNRTVAGATYIFNGGAVNVNGNFSYTNNAGGLTKIHETGASPVPITGTVDITASGTGNPVFLMRRVQNQATGGTISVQNSGLITIEYNTLFLNAFNVNGFTSIGVDDFNQNSITGDVNISDGPTNTSSIYIRNCIINGNTTYTQNSASTLIESYQGSNVYNGNVNLVNNLGIISFASSRATTVNQNLTLNSTTGITFTDTLKLGGSINGIIEQLGTQPVIIPKLLINKTGGADFTLNDSVTITTKVTFTSGNIITSASRELVFDAGTTHSETSATSHVLGPVTKIGNNIFTFPVGGPITYNPISISAPTGVTSRFRAEYKNQNPSIDGYNTNTKAGSFGTAQISNAGYWDVKRLSGATNVTLTLGFNPNPYEQYPVLANLKVARWNGAQWDDHGNGGTTATTVLNSVTITSYTPGIFTIAGVIPTYLFVGGQPGPGPDGSPIKLKGIGGWPDYTVKQLPAGSYTADSIFLVANGSTTTFRLKDLYGVEKDTTITAPANPASYVSANGNGTVNFVGWRHFVYMRDGSGNMMGAIRDNDLTIGNTTMNTYFSTANVATAPNGNIFLKRSFKITSQFTPVGTKRVRLYISKTEFTNLVAADPTGFPSGINSLTITKYTGPQEDSLFNPIPGGNAIIIPNSEITIADLGTMYSLDIDVTGFSGFYIGGNQSNVNICTGSTISLPSNINGTTYQWQVEDGSGYANISNTGVYSGATTKALTLTNTPGTMYGYKLRCFVNGSTYSQEYTLKFTAEWQGTVSNAWENTANWSCGTLPDTNTDVILNAGKPNFPNLNSNRSIRTLKANPGAVITVKTGFNLTILK